MLLKYYDGSNFGDAINPMLFNHLLPNFFNQDEHTLFLGVGSILGFLKGDEKTRKIIVFSSGYAYDEIPVIDARYDIRCVRGPLTASALKIDPKLAIYDGSILLRSFEEFKQPVEKMYKFSYIPHYRSEDIFDRWENVFRELGIHYISPRGNPVDIIRQILQSEYVLAEAMHGAIFADFFRVPWIPVKMFTHINDFKWRDWLMSVNMEYQAAKLRRLYNNDWIQQIIYNKLRFSKGTTANRVLSSMYKAIQTHLLEEQYKRELKKIMYYAEPLLSNEQLLNSKEAQLLEILEGVKRDYSTVC